MIKTYRKKPVEIQAMQFITNNEAGDKNINEIVFWMNESIQNTPYHYHNGTNIYIQTLEGEMTASVGDYITN